MVQTRNNCTGAGYREIRLYRLLAVFGHEGHAIAISNPLCTKRPGKLARPTQECPERHATGVILNGCRLRKNLAGAFQEHGRSEWGIAMHVYTFQSSFAVA